MSLMYNDFVIVNKYSRPAIKLLDVRGIVLHYTASPGGTAEGHQNYFDGADGGGSRYAGAHIFVDRDSAVCLIPLDEVAYHANEKPSKVSKLRATASYYQGGNANLTTIGIEMCIEKDGSLHPDTVERTRQIVKLLLDQYKLTPNDVYRHYDITGKNCPAMWVANPSLFVAFKNSLKDSKVAQVSNPVHKDVTAHVVAKGETLYSIAKLHGTTVEKLKAMNGLKSDALSIGQKIILKETVTVASTKPVSKPVSKPKYTLPTGVLKKGAKGTAVKQLQTALVALKFYPDAKASNKGIDGIFGNATYDALKRFQSVYANPADGIYGSATRKAMDRLLNK